VTTLAAVTPLALAAVAAALGCSLTLCHPRMIASVASWPQCLRKRGIELKVGIEIEIETELEVGIEIDMIRYRGKTSSPAIITLLGQAPEIAN
jgi:hypothetical protein